MPLCMALQMARPAYHTNICFIVLLPCPKLAPVETVLTTQTGQFYVCHVCGHILLEVAVTPSFQDA